MSSQRCSSLNFVLGTLFFVVDMKYKFGFAGKEQSTKYQAQSQKLQQHLPTDD